MEARLMRTAIEQLQDIVIRLVQLGEDAQQAFIQAGTDRLDLSGDLLVVLGYATGVAEKLLSSARDGRKTQD
jgi:hypothetical protein